MFIKMWQKKFHINGQKFVLQNVGEDIKFWHLQSNLN
jgi:hypothetical protein